jgi:hypothetical protein
VLVRILVRRTTMIRMAFLQYSYFYLMSDKQARKLLSLADHDYYEPDAMQSVRYVVAWQLTFGVGVVCCSIFSTTVCGVCIRLS